jgi:hypothetical protein
MAAIVNYTNKVSLLFVTDPEGQATVGGVGVKSSVGGGEGQVLLLGKGPSTKSGSRGRH